jgi:hypothetical protein
VREMDAYRKAAIDMQDSLLCCRLFAVRRRKFPVSWRRELAKKALYCSVYLAVVGSPSHRNRQIPCLQGICLETGAISTASPAKHSLNQREWAHIG